MKTPTTIALLALSVLPSQGALILLSQGSFDIFEPTNVPVPEIDLNWFVHLDDVDNDVIFTVRNDGTEAVVTKFFVEDDGGILSNPVVVGPLPGVDYAILTGGGTNLPGGNNIGFTTDFAFGPNPSPIANGIGIGEEAQFRFDWNGEAEDIRIAAHVQSIDLNVNFTSASYVSHVSVPEPSGALLLSFASLGLAFRRRR